MHVLTRAINQYDQDGDYFEAVWINKPSIDQLKKFGFTPEYCHHLLNNGGDRINQEETWYFLTEIKEGEEYKHSNNLFGS